MRRRRRGTLETVATGLVGRWTSLSEEGWLQGMLSRMAQLLDFHFLNETRFISKFLNVNASMLPPEEG